MAVPDQTPYNIYTANGVTTIFPYEFYLINADDLTVSLDGEAVSTGFNLTGIDNVNGGEVTFLTPPAKGVIVMLERVVAPVRLTEYQDNGDLLADTVNLDFDRLWMAIKQSFVSLGFALLRPVSGGPFSAKGYRIASLADPVNDQDAATKGYANTLDKKTNQHTETLNNATNNRALRVPEAVIPPIPDAATRAGKLLSFDALGAPIAALPPAGTAADVLTELTKSDGATKIGSQQPDGKSETVQQALSAIRKAVENKLDIGGAVNTLVSRGRVPALSGNDQGTAGIQMYEAYNNGYPTPYGNVIHLKGASASGEGELLMGWSGTSGAHAPLYIRSRRDLEDAPWSAWAQVCTANELAGIPLPFPGEVPPSGWLRCNGQEFNKTAYPVLASFYPTGNLPDLRGEFIRGWDDGREVDTGRSLLSAQNDAMQPITAKWVMDDQAAGGGIDYPPSGAFYIDSTAKVNYDAASSHHRGGARGVFDSSRQTRTANETRPRNIAFNYIVRAV